MTKKKTEQVYESPQEEIKALRRQIAGLKGNITVQQNIVKELGDKLVEREKVVAGLHEQVMSLREKKQQLELEVQVLTSDKEYYDGLKWWQRIFYKGCDKK